GQSFRASTFPSSQRRGVRDIKNNGSVPICRGRGGQFGTLRRPAELTIITASRYRARASRPSAPLLWLRDIFLMAQPLLLCEEGEYDAFKFCPSGNIIDIWLRRSGAVVLRTAQSVRQPPFRRPNSSS